MTKSFVRLIVLLFLGSLLVPVVTTICSHFFTTPNSSPTFISKTALSVVTISIATALIYMLLKRLEPQIDANARESAKFLDSLPVRYLDLAIFASAAVSLFLELSVIRWQGTVFEFFAFYKNFGLLSCFAGLGLGYA